MSDINLLPIEQHHKEKQERKINDKERGKFEIELTDPNRENVADKEYELPAKSKGFSAFFKKIFGRQQSQKQKDHQQKLEDLEVAVTDNQQREQEKRKALFKFEPKKEVNEKNEKVASPAPIKDKHDLYRSLDINERKLALAKQHRKQEFSLGKEVRGGLDVNLMPYLPTTVRISNSVKVLVLLLVFLISAMAVAAIFLWIDADINKRMANVKYFDEINQKLSEQIDKFTETNREAVKLQERLEKLDFLVANHFFPSKIFEYLEANTLPGVYYTEINFDAGNNYLRLGAVAADWQQAAEQLLFFRSDSKNINYLKSESFNLSEFKDETTVSQSLFNNFEQTDQEKVEVVTFDLEIIFNKDFLH